MVDRPGAVLRFLFRRLFSAIRFGEAEATRIREAADQGPIVYVLRTVSYIEYLYFNYALKRHGLPLARFANGGVRTVLLWPLHIALSLLVSLWRFARGAHLEAEEAAMIRRVEAGDATLLFLRPHHRLVGDTGAAARVRGRFTDELIALQRRSSGSGREIRLVPMTLLWGHPAVRPGGRGPIDALFGEPETPGRVRAFFQFVRHHRSSVVKVAEPIVLGAFLAENAAENPERSDEALARTLRFELSGRIERERRAVLGPPTKNARRVRLGVMRSRRLARAIDDVAAKKGIPKKAVAKRAEALLAEIAATPRHWAIAFLRGILSVVFARIYDGIDVDEEGLDRLREAAKRGPLVLCPSHRSHVDYLVLSYVFYGRGLPPPHIAAGANLSFFPLGPLFRRSAAFFLRRSFRGDALYAAVFAAYVRRLLRDGFNVEFFIEGGRSRTGKLMTPKLGLLGIVADAALDGDAPSVMAVPIAITYEKIVEAGSYARELAGGAKRKEDLGALFRARRVLRSRYGRIDLRIGEPFGIADALAAAGAKTDVAEEGRRQAVRRLGHRIMYLIGRATPVTPSSLVAASCLATVTRGVTRRELDRRVRWLAACVRASGTRLASALEEDFVGAVERSLELLAGGGDLELRGAGDEALVVVPDERRVRLEYYKNNLIHALGDASIVARALVVAGAGEGDGAPVGLVRDRALTASRLLKNELIYRPGAGFDALFEDTLGGLEAAGWLTRGDGRARVTEEGAAALPVLAGQTAAYLASYRHVVGTVVAHPKLAGRELTGKTVAEGERALVLGELRRAEAISRPVFENAVDFLRELGALGEPDKLAGVADDLDAVMVAGE